MPQAPGVVEGVVGRAVRELGAEGFDEGFAPADAGLVDEEPGAVFGGAVWGAEIG